MTDSETPDDRAAPATLVHSSSGAPKRADEQGEPKKKAASKPFEAADFANLPVPDELLKFNVLLAAEKAAASAAKKERKQAADLERRVADAEKAKDDAAKRVRDLASDPKATREKKEAAEATYKDAVARLLAIREGKDPDAEAKADAPQESGAPASAAAEDGATEDGATEDGATEDGAAEDGAAAAPDEGAPDEGAADDGATGDAPDEGDAPSA